MSTLFHVKFHFHWLVTQLFLLISYYEFNFYVKFLFFIVVLLGVANTIYL